VADKRKGFAHSLKQETALHMKEPSCRRRVKYTPCYIRSVTKLGSNQNTHTHTQNEKGAGANLLF